MKKKKISTLGALAIAAATMLGGAQQANANVPADSVQSQQNKKEALPKQQQSVRPEAERNKEGGFSGIRNPYKTQKSRMGLNQRQKRKHWASNPHTRPKR